MLLPAETSGRTCQVRFGRFGLGGGVSVGAEGRFSTYGLVGLRIEGLESESMSGSRCLR